LSEEDIELLCAECDADVLNAFANFLANENHTEASIQECQQALASKVTELRERIEAERAAQAQAQARLVIDVKRAAPDQAPKKERSWTPEELSMLAKYAPRTRMFI
jgi:hypothetical protein